MTKSIIAAAALLLATAPAASGQVRDAPSRTSISAGPVMYTTISSIVDPDSDSRWTFDDTGFGFGAGVQREFGQGLLIGVEGTYATTRQERSYLDTDVVFESGDAAIATGMLTGRFAYGGGGTVGIYLTGGAGTIAYKLDSLDGWNPDFALRAGTGIEYQFAVGKGIALEWNRIWGYHEKEDLGGGRQNHSVLKLLGRLAL
ncbi:MAG: outer membrane beta-barrel protein [Gemmatimonadota bacterium]